MSLKETKVPRLAMADGGTSGTLHIRDFSPHPSLIGDDDPMTDDRRAHVAHATIRDARSLANRLDFAILAYMILGVLGSMVLILNRAGDGFLLGTIGVLSTALTAGCAWALVHGLRLLAVIAEKDYPPAMPTMPIERQRPPARSALYDRMDSNVFLVCMTVGVLALIGAVVVAALMFG